MSTINDPTLAATPQPQTADGVLNKPELAPDFAKQTAWSRNRHLQYWWQNAKFAFPLLVSDLIALICCHAVVVALMEIFLERSNAARIVQTSAIPILMTLVAGAFLRLYPGIGLQPVIELRQTVYAVLLSHFATICMFAAFKNPPIYAYLPIVVSGFLAVIIVPSARQFVRQYLGSTEWWPIPVFVFAGGPASEMIWRNLRLQSSLGWRPVGIIEDFFSEWEKSADLDHHYVGVDSDVQPLAERNQVFWGVVDGFDNRSEKVSQILDRHLATLPKIVTITDTSSSPSLWVQGTECAGLPGLTFENRLQMFFPRLIKRTFDIVVAASILALASPFLALFAVLIKLSSKGPILYSQPRYGYLGKVFRIWKFRSMVENADAVLIEHFKANPELLEEYRIHHKLARDPRITWIGKFLRRTSIDEIPQLWNVLVGEMSIVGPRPILMNEHEKYGDVFPLYCRMKPGITGLWQVNGRNQTAYEARLVYAAYYIRNWSIWLDWYILLKTVRVVLFCEGAC
jgi:Undecaprenyl-phosphate galactose phosphotransferase WbaP